MLVVRSIDFSDGTNTVVARSAMSVDAVFFTRVHFDIFGLFYPRAVPDLLSATKLLMDVYGAANLTLCITGTQLISVSSSSLSSRLFNGQCSGEANRLPDTEIQHLEVYRQELDTLHRFGRFLPRDAKHPRY